MKLQNLTIIFIIIIIPIVLIFTLYLNLETKTITMQTNYDEKLIEATKEAIEAFEINTTEWNNEYSLLANAKRQSIMSSINVFTTGLADKLGIGGTSKEAILSYVPAIVFTMYDGYYIYAPTHVPQSVTDGNGIQLFYYNSASNNTKVINSATQNIKGEIVSGEPIYYLDTNIAGSVATGTTDDGISFTTKIERAQKIYKHVLKTFVPYTGVYGDYTINYTLDDYIRIYGKEKSQEGYKVKLQEGYYIDNFFNANKGTTRIVVPVNSISEIKFDNILISPETLKENIPIKNKDTGETTIQEYQYIYNSNNDKRYYDSTKQQFFMLNKYNEKVFLPDAEVGGTLAEYKKLLIRPNIAYNYLELYQLLNKNDNNWYYKGIDNQYHIYGNTASINAELERGEDCSSINYYVDTWSFNYWLRDNDVDTKKILKNKTQDIVKNINNNLNLSLSNYSANAKVDYILPELTEKDWEQALSNISIITFFQGKKIGLKTYNNYAVVSSTQNNEYVNEESLYYLGNNNDKYYHRSICRAIDRTALAGYRNTEFKPQTADGGKTYYYKHILEDSSGNQYNPNECFFCIVNRNMKDEIQGEYDGAKENALGRERYVQMQKTRLIDNKVIFKELNMGTKEFDVTYTQNGN